MQTKRSEIISALLDKLRDFNYLTGEPRQVVVGFDDYGVPIFEMTSNTNLVKTNKGIDIDTGKPIESDAITHEARADFIWGDGNRVYLSNDESVPYNSVFQVRFIFPKAEGARSLDAAEEFTNHIKLGFISDATKDVTVFDRSVFGDFVDGDRAYSVASFTIKTI
jgi:hypothetical protein